MSPGPKSPSKMLSNPADRQGKRQLELLLEIRCGLYSAHNPINSHNQPVDFHNSQQWWGCGRNQVQASKPLQSLRYIFIFDGGKIIKLFLLYSNVHIIHISKENCHSINTQYLAFHPPHLFTLPPQSKSPPLPNIIACTNVTHFLLTVNTGFGCCLATTLSNTSTYGRGLHKKNS